MRTVSIQAVPVIRPHWREAQYHLSTAQNKLHRIANGFFCERQLEAASKIIVGFLMVSQGNKESGEKSFWQQVRVQSLSRAAHQLLLRSKCFLCDLATLRFTIMGCSAAVFWSDKQGSHGHRALYELAEFVGCTLMKDMLRRVLCLHGHNKPASSACVV